MMYGLPGKPGYNYSRPFDYFEFEMTAISNRVTRSIRWRISPTRGILVGTDYEGGNSYRGLWGLYGSYDYIARDDLRVSTTALSLGTTGQWWLSRSVALQGSALAGVGYGAAAGLPVWETVIITMVLRAGALFSAAPYWRHRHARGDGTGILYQRCGVFNSGGAGDYRTPRHGPHGPPARPPCRRHPLPPIDRDGDYTGMPTQHQKVDTFALVYTILSDIRFGAVEWRETR